MKPHVYLVAALLMGCSQTPNQTASPAPSPSALTKEERRERFRKFVAEMDTDHDGKLSDAEREVGFDKRLKDSERFRKRTDRDGDGKISPEERKAGLETFMKRRSRRPQRDDASPAPSDSENPE